MGRKNRIFKGNLKASQILAVLMLIVMIIRPIMEVSAKPGEITTENPSAEVGKEGESLSDGIDGSALYPLEENGQNGQTSENDAVRQNGQTSDETDAKNSPNAINSVNDEVVTIILFALGIFATLISYFISSRIMEKKEF